MIQNIQILRAIAAYLVVIYHIQPHASHFLAGPIHTHIGASGVDIFFVISGFIMVFTNAERDRKPVDFWRDRIIRIVPLYWLAIFAMIAVNLVGFAPSGLHSWDGGDLITSLLFFPDIRKDGVPEPILSPGWTLIYEMFFYLLFGMTLLLRNMMRAILLVTAVFLGLWVAGKIVQPTSFAAAYYTNPIMLEFTAGGLLGLLYTRTHIFKSRRPRLVSVSLAALATATIVLSDQLYPGQFYRAPEFRLLSFGIPAIMIVSAALVLEKSCSRYVGRFLLLQGAASYAVYLFHPLLVHATFKVPTVLYSGESSIIATLTTLVAIFVVCIIGTSIHLGIEKPLTRTFKSIFGRPIFAPISAQP